MAAYREFDTFKADAIASKRRERDLAGRLAGALCGGGLTITSMFVRFQRHGDRLQVTLVETRRVAGRMLQIM
jgi:hypothetical protein